MFFVTIVYVVRITINERASIFIYVSHMWILYQEVWRNYIYFYSKLFTLYFNWMKVKKRSIKINAQCHTCSSSYQQLYVLYYAYAYYISMRENKKMKTVNVFYYFTIGNIFRFIGMAINVNVRWENILINFH